MTLQRQSSFTDYNAPRYHIGPLLLFLIGDGSRPHYISPFEQFLTGDGSWPLYMNNFLQNPHLKGVYGVLYGLLQSSLFLVV